MDREKAERISRIVLWVRVVILALFLILFFYGLAKA